MSRETSFPRSRGYDEDWVLRHQMGPNVLWLAEWLCQGLDLQPGMRVLDLGCGKGLSSCFVAREFGVQVWAADLWVHPDDVFQAVTEADQSARVCPLRVEAHALPFAQRFFDAVISIDAYQYFGTDDLYLRYLARFVRNGGQLGIVVPGLMQEFGNEIPAHLTTPQSNGTAFWEDECVSFHTPQWWHAQVKRARCVDAIQVDTLADGWRHWRDFERMLEHSGRALFPSVAEALDADAGRYLGFVRMRARVREGEGLNLYDPSLIARMAGDPEAG
ncbi:MAG: methyltransferase domain-containing protein [Pseudomonadota bacterium]